MIVMNEKIIDFMMKFIIYLLERSSVLAAAAALSNAEESKRYASIAFRSDDVNGADGG